MTAATGAPPELDIALSDLPPRGPALGKGGEANVYDLPGFTLPDVTGPLVYKEYLHRRSAHGNLSRIVALRSGLRPDPARLARLDAVTAWPVRQVLDGGDAVGVLMPRIPDGFFCTIRKPQSGQHERVPAEVQFILVPPTRALPLEYPLPSPDQRLAICRDFARALAFLHDEMKVVFGDVNAKNELIRLNDKPTVMLIDCDAVRVTGQIAQQMETPDWTVEPAEPSSVQSDPYKLGLFVLRCLSPKDRRSDERDPAVVANTGLLDATGMGLLRAALAAPSTQRPTADHWVRYLSRLLGDVTAPPRLLRAALSKTVTVQGEPLTLDWAATEAHVLEVSGAGCPPVSVDATAGRGTVELYPTQTGRFTVRVTNTLPGEDVLRTEPVAVLELFRRHDIPVPVPTFEMPRLDYLELPNIAAMLPPVPLPGAASLPSMDDPVGWWSLPLPPGTNPAAVVPEPGVWIPDLIGDVPDLLPMLTGAPSRDNDPYVRGEVIR